MKKVVITAALSGSLPTKAQTTYVPITPTEIAKDAKACYDAGAAVVHIHARDGQQNSTHDFDIFAEINSEIKKVCPDVIVQISTGGRAGVGYNSRSKGLGLNPESASLTTGSVNFPGSVYENSPELVYRLAKDMYERGILPELEIFDTSMIAPALELYAQGILRAPLYFNFVMGMKNIQAANIGQLNLLLGMLPTGCNWSISGVGKAQIWTTYMGIAMGGNVRVGLEDNIYLHRGVLGSNFEFVARTVRLAQEFGRGVATADEARAILGIVKNRESKKLMLQ